MSAVRRRQMPSAAISCSLGDARVCAGDLARGREAVRPGAEIARTLSSPERIARAALAYGIEVESGLVDSFLIGLLEEALARLPEPDSTMRAIMLARLSLALYWSPQPERRRALSAEAVAMARRLADPVTLAMALEARHFALGDPENATERLAVADELVRLAAVCGNPDLAVRGPYWRIGNLIEIGDIAATDAAIAHHARLAEASRQPFYMWVGMVVQGARALLGGDFAEAERLIAEAFAAGAPLNRPGTLGVYGVQLYSLRWEQGRLSETEMLFRAGLAQFPHQPHWRCALALLLCETDRPREARIEFERLAEHDFTDLPHDQTYLVTLVILAEVCAALGDGRRAALLYPLLLPSNGRAVIIQPTVAYLGPAARSLGLLAATIARDSDDESGRLEAHRHFADAIALAERMTARPFLARTWVDYAAALIGRMKDDGGTLNRAAAAECAEAAALLDEGLTVARELGMARVVTRATRLQTDLDVLAARLEPETPQPPTPNPQPPPRRAEPA